MSEGNHAGDAGAIAAPTVRDAAPAAHDAPAFFWKTIERYDRYIESTIGRASMIIGFATFIVGTLVIKAGDVLAVFDAPSAAVVRALLLVLAATCAWSLTWAVAAIYPVVPPIEGEPPSRIYFASVAAYPDAASYHRAVVAVGAEGASKDAGEQAYQLAGIVKRKYGRLRCAVWGVVASLLFLGALLVLRVLLAVSPAVTR